MKLILLLMFSFSIFLSGTLSSLSPLTLDDIEYPLDVPLYIAPSIPDSNDQKDLYQFLVESYTNQNLTDRVFLLIKTLPKPLTILSKPLYKTLFLTYYQQHSAIDTMTLIDTVPKRFRNYMLEACFQFSLEQDSIDDAITFFKAIDSPIMSSQLCNLLITYFVMKNDPDKAWFYHDLIQLPAEKEQSLSTLAILSIQSGNIQQINNSLTSITNPSYRHTLLLNVVKTLMDMNQIETANHFLKQLKSTDIYDKALVYVIKTTINNDDFEQAIDYAQTLSSQRYKKEAILLLGNGFARTGNFKAINSLLMSIEMETEKNEFIASISLSLAQNNYLQESFDISSKLPHSIQETHFPTLITATSTLTDYHFILFLIKQIDNYHIVNQTLSSFAASLARQNNHKKALEVLNDISDVSIQQRCLLNILSLHFDLGVFSIYQPFITQKTLISIIQSFPNENSYHRLALDYLELYQESISIKKLTKSDQLSLHIELGIAAIHMDRTKDSLKHAKIAHKLIRKLAYKSSITTLHRYLYLESHLSRSNHALSILKKYPKNIAILYTLDSIYSHDTSLHKALISFAKDFNK